MDDRLALQIARSAGLTLSPAELQFVLAVARGESFYGAGWKAGEGAGSHNWGAVQGKGPAGSFNHLDHHADGTPYTTAFRAYNTDAEGFQDLVRIALKPNVRDALATGDASLAVSRMHDNKYFELDPFKYTEAVQRNYQALLDKTGEKGALSFAGPKAPISTIPAPAPDPQSSLPPPLELRPSSFGGLSAVPAILPTLRVGSHGPAVELWFGTTKTYTPNLVDVVASWQRARGLKGDGIIGPLTWDRYILEIWRME